MAITTAIIGAAVTVGGTGVTMFGQSQAAKAQAKLAARQQEIKNQQANEMLIRAEQNARALKRQKHQLRGRTVSAASGSGAAISGSIINKLADDAAQFELLELNMRREANAGATALRQGAELDAILSNDAQRAANINQIATGLSGAKSTASGLTNSKVFDKTSKTVDTV